MPKNSRPNPISLMLVYMVSFLCLAAWADDPLPSWKDGQAKESVISFVTKVTKKGTSDFVPVPERIAVFDNDGTLWAEKPVYFQFLFAIDRVKALAPQHPEWKDQQPYQAALEDDLQTLLKGGVEGMLRLVMSTHAGLSTGEFAQTVGDWLATAKHPKTNRPFTEMVYQPMLELLVYLQANGFKTFIVSGGSLEFMRPWTERVYGIPPEQIIGSTVKLKSEIHEGKPVILRQAELDFINDKETKPVSIEQHIGRRPIAAFGNSDGDLPMLQWTAAGDGPRFCLYVHHDDADREWAYDRDSPVGRLDKGLVEAEAKGWTVVSMKEDWIQVFPPQK